MDEGLFDIDLIEAMLRAAAAAHRQLTYSEVLAAFGLSFSRPRMRALCAAIDRVDARAAAAGEPELAVLVVRASDGLPGQGWWVGRDYWQGAWKGSDALVHVQLLHATAHEFWRDRAVSAPDVPARRY
jgi:hypothetical protein